MKRKLLSIILVLVFVLSACGRTEETVKRGKKRDIDAGNISRDKDKDKDKDKKTPTPTPTKEEKKTLRLWTTAAEGDAYYFAYEQAIEELKHIFPDVDVIVERTYSDEYKMKLKVAMQNNDVADIFYTWSCSFLGDFVDMGKVYCLDDMYQNYRYELPEVMCRYTNYNGKQYGIPITLNVVTLFANMDLLKQVGYTDIPATYEDFVRCCDALLAKGITPFGMSGASNQEWCISEYLEPIMVKTAGAKTMDDIMQGKASWNNKDVEEAVQIFLNFLNKGYFDSDDFWAYNDEVKYKFLDGQYAFYQNGSWNCSELSDCGLNIKAAEFPVVNSAKSRLGQLVGGPTDALAVSQNAKDPELAAEYAYELAKRVSKYGYLYGIALPAWNINYDDSELGYLTRQMAREAADADYLVLFGDTCMRPQDVSTYLYEISKLYNGQEDAAGFIRNMDFAMPFNGSGSGQTDDYRDLRGLEVVILDWWSSPDLWDDVSNGYEEAFFDMLHEAEKEHNFKIRRQNGEYGWGDSYIESVLLSISDNCPDGSIILLDNRWVAPLLSSGKMLDVSRVSTVDWNDDKWNKAVKDLMTVNGAIYGFAAGTEARTGVFFNKDIFKQLGIDPDVPYDLQKEGKWSWETYLQLCKEVTKDTNNDGVTDIYAVAGQPYIVVYSALLSNGTFVIEKTADGLLQMNADDPDVKAALEFVRNSVDLGYFMPTPAKADWDWYKNAFYDGKTAMYIEEEWAGPQEIRARAPWIDYGFVCHPYGPAVGKTVSIIRENVLFIPNCDKTKSIADDIMYAYNWYTTVPEEYIDDDLRWKLTYGWQFNDERAVTETIRMMIIDCPQYMDAGCLAVGFGENTSWCDNLINGKTVQATISENRWYWQDEVDQFNAKFW